MLAMRVRRNNTRREQVTLANVSVIHKRELPRLRPPPFDTEVTMNVAVHSRGRKRKRRPALDIPPQIHVRGNLLEFLNGKAWEPPPAREKREKISTFSQAARLRLLKALLGIDYRNSPLSVAITLTYPDERIPRDQYQRGKDRSKFLRYIETHLKRPVYGLWRTEWLPRETGSKIGYLAPHIHLVLFGIRFIHYETINGWWKKCITWDHYVRTEIRRARKERTTLHYLSKYISKPVDSSLVIASYPNNPDGKHYDWVRRPLVPMYPHLWFGDLTDEEVEYVFALHHRTWPESECKLGESFSIMGKAVQRAIGILREMRLTGDPGFR